ncbi:sulfotransferase [Bacteroidota bacterium]
MSSNRIVTARDFAHTPKWFNAINALWERTYPIGSRPSLDKDNLLQTAQRITGLNNFGNDFWDEPLERLIESVREDARLTAFGYFITRNRIINLLSVRLRAEEWFRKYPGILEQEVLPPMVIVGLQRTGTTKLHRLLTADPDNRVLRSWEAINPAPLHSLNGSQDRRVKIARKSEKALQLMAPGFFAIHPVEHNAPEEDILLLDTTFLSTTPEATMHVPSYASWLEETDQSPAYEYGSKLLKLLQWQAPGKRWVLKSPHHLEFMPLIKKHFGNPHFIWTHRNPIECIPSFLSMVCHSRAIFSNDVRIEEVVEHWVRKTSYMLGKGIAFRTEKKNEELFTDVLYEQLVKDPMSQLTTIYNKYGGISADLKRKFEEVESDNPQGKYGIHLYSHRDFGIHRKDLYEMNKEYCKIFYAIHGKELELG